MNEIAIEVVSPFPVEELPRVWVWMQDAPHALLSNIGPQTVDEFVDYWLPRNGMSWGVWRDGVLGGWLAYEAITEISGNVHCVFKKGVTRADSFFGHKTTIPACNAMFEDLFAIGVERIGMVVFQSNKAIQSLIKVLGGELESIHVNPRTETGEPILLHGHTEPEPLLQYALYKRSFGQPNTNALTYGEWIKRVAQKERGACA